MSTILVADDNSNIQKMVTLALKDEGIDVVSVGNGEAAIRKIPEVSPALVLADIFMPVRNGYEVCDFVKHDPRFAHVPVILLVGAFDPLDEHEAERVGADGVLKKPFVPPDPLIALVKALLAKSVSEHALPVSVPEPVSVATPVGARSPASVVATGGSLEELANASSGAGASVPSAAPPTDDFPVLPAPVSFREGEKPLAWSDLLDTPAADSDAKAPRPSTASFPGAGLGEMRLWQGVTEEPATERQAPAWGDPGTALPPSDDEALPHPVESKTEFPSASAMGEASPAADTQATAQPAHPFSPIEGLRWGADPLPWDTRKDVPEGVAPATLPWETKPLHPEIPDDEVPSVAQPVSRVTPPKAAAPSETPPSSTHVEYEYPGVYVEELPGQPKTIEGVSLTTAPPAGAPEATLGEFVAEVPEAQQSAVAETPRVSAGGYASESREPGLTAPVSPKPAASIPQQPDPAMVEAVVTRVLEKMQPQILEIVTREILKPVAEALVRKELEKH